MSAGLHRVVGIDGGGTRLRAVLADTEGRTLAESEGGAGLVGAGEDEAVADRLIEQVQGLASGAGVDLPIDSMCAGLAGVAGRPNAQAAVEARIRSGSAARRVRVVPDYEIAFVDAFGRGTGILLIAGTGSVAVGRAAEGGLVRVGGWGALLGDEGSGYSVGLRGVRVAVRAAEHRDHETTLTGAIFQALNAATPQDVFQWSKTASKADVAALAPRVVEEAERGDEVAGRILTLAVDGLVRHAQALTRTLDLTGQPAVALVGGLIEPGGPLRIPLTESLEEAGFQPVLDPISPVRGAVRIALEEDRG